MSLMLGWLAVEKVFLQNFELVPDKVTSFFQSITLSKRFSPELFNFLSGVVFMSTPKDAKTVVPFVPPFKVVGKESTLLSDFFKKR